MSDQPTTLLRRQYEELLADNVSFLDRIRELEALRAASLVREERVKALLPKWRRGVEVGEKWPDLDDYIDELEAALVQGGTGMSEMVRTNESATCPVCEKTGSDSIEQDFDTGALEAECGDPFHAETHETTPKEGR